MEVDNWSAEGALLIRLLSYEGLIESIQPTRTLVKGVPVGFFPLEKQNKKGGKIRVPQCGINAGGNY